MWKKEKVKRVWGLTKTLPIDNYTHNKISFNIDKYSFIERKLWICMCS